MFIKKKINNNNIYKNTKNNHKFNENYYEHSISNLSTNTSEQSTELFTDNVLTDNVPTIDQNISDNIGINDNIGILDVKGKYPNPLTNTGYSPEYIELAKIWSKFPAYENRLDIINTIRNNQIVLVVSGTGSGKTVLIPKFVLHTFNYKDKIAISLPKQIIAKSAAEFAAKTLDVKIGNQVGYQYKGSDSSGRSNNNLLLYATDGTIVSKLMKDPLLMDYKAVIIDEAHERKVQIDFLLYLLKNTVQARKDFKLIIMSATVNEQIFKDYFDEFYVNNQFATINIGAKTNYPIESIFLPKSIYKTANFNEYMEEGYKILKKIMLDDTEYNNILFFVTSSNEAMKLCEKMSLDSDFINGNNENLCVEMYSGMNNEKQELAQDVSLYKTKYNKKRKIVIATNVVESSLTIDGIKYVIDSGVELVGYYDPINNCKVLKRQMITHAQAKQRMGRTGRTGPGICYHLYMRDEFENKMIRFPEPTIRISDITSESLKLLADPSVHNFNDLINIYGKFIEPPREIYIRSCFEKLKQLNLINENNEISKLGKIVNDLRLDPEFGVCCVVAKKLRCIDEVFSIICCLDAGKNNMSEFFKLPKDIVKMSDTGESDGDSPELKNKFNFLDKKFKEAVKKNNTKYGDISSLLKIFTRIKDILDDKKYDKFNDYCYANFLNTSVWNKAYQYYNKGKYMTRDILKGIDYIEIDQDEQIINKVITCFYFTYKNNTIKKTKEKYTNNRKLEIELSKNSLSDGDKLFYIELVNNFGSYEVSICGKITDSIENIYDIVKNNM